MSVQKAKKPVPKIPEKLIGSIETKIGQCVSKIDFRASYWKSGNTFEVFVVNGEYIITIINGKKIDPLIKSTKKGADEEQDFGRRVKALQTRTGLPYDLAKMAARKYPDLDSDAQRFLISIKIAKTKVVEKGEQGKQRLIDAMDKGEAHEVVHMMLACKVPLNPKEEERIIKYWLK